MNLHIQKELENLPNMITVTYYGDTIGEWDSIGQFANTRFKCAFNDARQLTISDPYEQKTQQVTQHSYGDSSLPEAVADWAESPKGREYLRQLGYAFLKEI